jgi:hypothetical protein
LEFAQWANTPLHVIYLSESAKSLASHSSTIAKAEIFFANLSTTPPTNRCINNTATRSRW